jgi:AbrB family looped-hinge helix DNA binding protein
MEAAMQLTLDRFGRMVLPKSLRDDLGLSQGDQLDVDERDGCVWLRPVRTQDPVTRKTGLLVYTGEATGDLLSSLDDHRRQRIKRVSHWNKKS